MLNLKEILLLYIFNLKIIPQLNKLLSYSILSFNHVITFIFIN